MTKKKSNHGPKKRNIVRWNGKFSDRFSHLILSLTSKERMHIFCDHTDCISADLDQLLLLTIQSVCNHHKIKIPWDEVANTMGHNATEGGIVQHLSKLRARRVEDHKDVPPPLGRNNLPGKNSDDSPSYPSPLSSDIDDGKSNRKTSKRKLEELNKESPSEETFSVASPMSQSRPSKVVILKVRVFPKSTPHDAEGYGFNGQPQVVNGEDRPEEHSSSEIHHDPYQNPLFQPEADLGLNFETPPITPTHPADETATAVFRPFQAQLPFDNTPMQETDLSALNQYPSPDNHWSSDASFPPNDEPNDFLNLNNLTGFEGEGWPKELSGSPNRLDEGNNQNENVEFGDF